jgi:hypothetical protein
VIRAWRDVSSPALNNVRRALTAKLTSHLAPVTADGGTLRIDTSMHGALAAVTAAYPRILPSKAS